MSNLTGPEDFTALQMSLTFDPNTTRHDITVAISNDIIVEPDQDFTSRLQLSTAEDRVKLMPDVTNIIIMDDDSKQALPFSHTSQWSLNKDPLRQPYMTPHWTLKERD